MPLDYSQGGFFVLIKSMLIHLEGLDGPAKGLKFNLVPGLWIGRTDCQISWDDPMLSHQHAQIEVGEKGLLFLVDRGSSNGLRLAGRRVERVALNPGCRFQVGSSGFVVHPGHVEQKLSMTAKEAQESGVNPFQVIKETVPLLQAENREPTPGLGAFRPPVILRILEGLQAFEVHTMGYGPRSVGSETFDLELFEPTCPRIAFTLSPTEVGGVRYKTDYQSQVLLNEKELSTDVLVKGDRIRIGDTLIEIDFLDLK